MWPGEWPGVHSTRSRRLPISIDSAPSSCTDGSAVLKNEDVDEPVPERDRQAELEHARRNLAQREFNRHAGIVHDPAKMSTRPYSNVLKTKPIAALEEPMSEVQMTPDQIVDAMP